MIQILMSLSVLLFLIGNYLSVRSMRIEAERSLKERREARLARQRQREGGDGSDK